MSHGLWEELGVTGAPEEQSRRFGPVPPCACLSGCQPPPPPHHGALQLWRCDLSTTVGVIAVKQAVWHF